MAERCIHFPTFRTHLDLLFFLLFICQLFRLKFIVQTHVRLPCTCSARRGLGENQTETSGARTACLNLRGGNVGFPASSSMASSSCCFQARTSADLPSRWGVKGRLQLKHAAAAEGAAVALVNLQLVWASLDLQETFTAEANAASTSRTNLRVGLLTPC